MVLHHSLKQIRISMMPLFEDFRLAGEARDILFEPSEQNYDFLVDTTEKWCQERAVYLALLESISIHDGQDKNKTRDSIPGLLSEGSREGIRSQ